MNLRMLVPCLLLTTLFACEGSVEYEHLERESQHEIIGGQLFDGLPAVGSITVNGYHSCTGTLISPRRVLTAAHCVVNANPSRMAFVLGASIYSADAIIPVVSAVAHPSYNSRTLKNDIGYLDLASDAPVAPMDVVNTMNGSWSGRELFFVGYGVNDGFRQTGSGIKRAVKISIAQVGDTQFSYSERNQNTCNGDSGGPAFWQDPTTQEFLLAGVTSYGDEYCQQYGVDTRVDAFTSFYQVQELAPPVDPCQGETFSGRCSGTTLTWCENETVESISCQSQCGYQASRGIYNCLQ